MNHSTYLLAAHVLASMSMGLLATDALAQGSATTPNEALACAVRAGAPEWMPCGANRTLSDADLKAHIVKDGMIAKLSVTGGQSGTKFFNHFLPGGKFEGGMQGGRNIGKSWVQEGNRLCRAFDAPISATQCVTFELTDAGLLLVDHDGSKSPVTSIEFSKP